MDHMVRVCFVINCQNIFRSGCINLQFLQAMGKSSYCSISLQEFLILILVILIGV